MAAAAASKDASSKALRARAIVVPVAGARCKFYDPLENLDSRRKGDREEEETLFMYL